MYSTAMRYAAMPNMDTIHSSRKITREPSDRNSSTRNTSGTSSRLSIPLRMRRWLPLWN